MKITLVLASILVLAGCGQASQDPSASRPTQSGSASLSEDQKNRAAPTNTAVEEQDRVRDCPDFDMQGEVNGQGAGYFDISVRNMSCAEAKPLILATEGGIRPDAPATAGFACGMLAEFYEGASFRCADSGGRAFRFSWGS